MNKYKGMTVTGDESDTEIEIVDVVDGDDAVANALITLDRDEFRTAGFDMEKLLLALQTAANKFQEGIGYLHVNDNGVLVFTEYERSKDGIVVMPMLTATEAEELRDSEK